MALGDTSVELLDTLQSQKVDIQLPSFEMSDDMALRSTLSALGRGSLEGGLDWRGSSGVVGSREVDSAPSNIRANKIWRLGRGFDVLAAAR